MIVLWLLILRGIGIELRMHVDSPVWRGLFYGAFGISAACCWRCSTARRWAT